MKPNFQRKSIHFGLLNLKSEEKFQTTRRQKMTFLQKPDLRNHDGYLQYDLNGLLQLDELGFPLLGKNKSIFEQGLEPKDLKKYMNPDNRRLSNAWYIDYEEGYKLVINQDGHVGRSIWPAGAPVKRRKQWEKTGGR